MIRSLYILCNAYHFNTAIRNSGIHNIIVRILGLYCLDIHTKNVYEQLLVLTQILFNMYIICGFMET